MQPRKQTQPEDRRGPVAERFRSIRREMIIGDRNETADRLFNLVIALLILPFALPILAFVALLVLVSSGRPILYQGVRLGRSRRHFKMYKFRTLREGVEIEMGAKLARFSDQTVTPLGEFLRRTRLDELPQLFNVLRGDMHLVGPRPVRPAVYSSFCVNIPGYDNRFAVRPGLIGQSQLFTPHGTPKRMRSLIDNRFLRRNHAWARDSLIIVVAVCYLTRAVILRLAAAAWRTVMLASSQRRLSDRRASERARLQRALVRWTDPSGNDQSGRLVDANEQAFMMTTTHVLSDIFPQQMVLEVPFRRSGAERIRRAKCTTELFNELDERDGLRTYVVRYSPISPFHYYLVHQYFLTESIIGPEHLCR